MSFVGLSLLDALGVRCVDFPLPVFSLSPAGLGGPETGLRSTAALTASFAFAPAASTASAPLPFDFVFLDAIFLSLAAWVSSSNAFWLSFVMLLAAACRVRRAISVFPDFS